MKIATGISGGQKCVLLVNENGTFAGGWFEAGDLPNPGWIIEALVAANPGLEMVPAPGTPDWGREYYDRMQEFLKNPL